MFHCHGAQVREPDCCSRTTLEKMIRPCKTCICGSSCSCPDRLGSLVGELKCSWILTSCQLHRVTSGRTDIVTSQYVFQSHLTPQSTITMLHTHDLFNCCLCQSCQTALDDKLVIRTAYDSCWNQKYATLIHFKGVGSVSYQVFS